MDASKAFGKVLSEVKKHIAGKTDIIELMFIGIVANGHCLLEGVPGVAKTQMTKALSDAIDADFARIQGTPDLDMRDIIGLTYFDEAEHEVKVKKGPIFTNILLMDELNRAPARTMAGFLEALEERQVTIPGAQTMKLMNPFIAFATQNPLNIEGTVALPKVLADRFLMRIAVSYPTSEEEVQMLRLKEHESDVKTEKVLKIEEILQMQKDVDRINISDEDIEYITRLVNTTRTDMHIVMGGSPRAEIAFMRCSKAKALIEGRSEVSIDDIKYLAKPVLSHRIVVRSTGGIGVNGIIDGIVANVK
ncbi:MAG: MoxR family ATPase [Candidatus Micrarchaeota archaeon]|nr:MoxR family ATPase [Candidatus Micrarchaeota archaeon]